MVVRSHTSVWRSLVAFAPTFGVAFIVIALFQGGSDIALSRDVYAVLAVVSLAGWWSAWSMARVASMPVVPIAQAKPGFVALRGRAQAFAERHLATPSGVPCVWFTYSTEPRSANMPHRRNYTAIDSMAPFTLVDDQGGRCIVLPDGADVTGGHEVPDSGGRERYIAEGDRLFVAGAFEEPSIDGVARVRAAFDASDRDPKATVIRTSGSTLEEARAERERLRAEMPTPTSPELLPQVTVPALPLMAAPRLVGSYVITAKDGENDAGLYGLIRNVDGVILVASIAMGVWLTLRTTAS
jgi:hypothetical protein